MTRCWKFTSSTWPLAAKRLARKPRKTLAIGLPGSNVIGPFTRFSFLPRLDGQPNGDSHCPTACFAPRSVPHDRRFARMAFWPQFESFESSVAAAIVAEDPLD